MANLPGPAGLSHKHDAHAESVWRAPLVPVALAFTAGVALDRLAQPPLGFSLLGGAAALIAFVLFRVSRPEPIGLAYLALAGVAFGSAYYHFRQDLYPEDDIGHLVSDSPSQVTLRGTLEEEPRRMPPPKPNPLRSIPALATASTIVTVTSLNEAGSERAVSGRVRVLVNADPKRPTMRLLDGLHPGDEVEVTGRLTAISGRTNPGEFDLAGYWHQRGVHAHMSLRNGDSAVRLLRTGWPAALSGWVGVTRGAGHDLLDRTFPEESLAALARALLLGEGAPMTTEAWGKYIRTGVVHVLAI